MKCNSKDCNNDAAFRKDTNKYREKCHQCLNFLKTYGITFPDKQKMLAKQDGCCKICRIPLVDGYYGSKKNKANVAFVDHCHTTGKIRGILCCNCNSVLGKALDNPTILRLAAEYLEK